MNEHPQSFAAPPIDEPVDSTVLAGCGAGLIVGSIAALVVGLVAGLVGWWEGWRLADRSSMSDWLFLGAFLGLVGVSILALGGVLFLGLGELTKRVQDGITRRQLARHQRLLRQHTFPHVPDRALSRCPQSDEPDPTPAALSRAEVSEEEAPPCLASEADAATEAEKSVVQTEKAPGVKVEAGGT